MSELKHYGIPFHMWSAEAQARHRRGSNWSASVNRKLDHRRASTAESDRKKWREYSDWQARQRRRNAGKKTNPADRPLRQQPAAPAIEPSKKPYWGPHNSEEAWTKPSGHHTAPVNNKREHIIKKAKDTARTKKIKK